MMVLFLHTPGLERIIGRSVALVTFEGRSTGRTFSVPVGYERDGGRIMMLSRASRRWWRNLRGEVPVRIRLSGVTHHGIASAAVARTGDLEDVRAFLSERRADMRAHGLLADEDGNPEETALRSFLPSMAIIRIELTDQDE